MQAYHAIMFPISTNQGNTGKLSMESRKTNSLELPRRTNDLTRWRKVLWYLFDKEMRLLILRTIPNQNMEAWQLV